jgi:hypothetical protein
MEEDFHGQGSFSIEGVHELVRADTRLPQGASKRADGQFPVEWDNAPAIPAAHDDMAAALACFSKPETFEDADGLLAGDPRQFRH